jgi:pullulanase
MKASRLIPLDIMLRPDAALFRCPALLAVVMLVVGCNVKREEKPEQTAPALTQAPEPKGPVVATIQASAPSGSGGKSVFGALRRDGATLARGSATVSDNGKIKIEMKSVASSAAEPGTCEVWLTINNDRLYSWFPSVGDLNLHQSLPLESVPATKDITEAGVWQEKKVSAAANLITVHYHRIDEDYESAGLWAWDSHQKSTPKENEVFEVGRDRFGPMFQLDRAEFGDSDRIGLLPRYNGNWKRKDGPDKFWNPALGNEVFLLSGKADVLPQQPDITPHLESGTIDSASRIMVRVSVPVTYAQIDPKKISVTDERKRRVPASERSLFNQDAAGKSGIFEIGTNDPLDFMNHQYSVALEGFGSVELHLGKVLDDKSAFYSADAVMGAAYSTTGTTFRVFAPTAHAVSVVLYDGAGGNNGRRVAPMKHVEKGLWEVLTPGDLQGKFYVFAIENGGVTKEVLDPYATNAVNSSSRGRITDLPSTNPVDWEKGKAGPVLASPLDAIIYEMHVRDFTIAPNSGVQKRGLYAGFVESKTRLAEDPAITTGLDHLTELGITHVQLMPVQDFDNKEDRGAYNWGYITTAFNSPEGMFASNIGDESRIAELKSLIAALHQRGIGVILDVVYNHTAESAPFDSIVPNYYYRSMPDGTRANGSGWGNEFRSESPMGHKFLLDSLKYWVNEYGVDGYRFDLMALIDLESMKDIDRELRKIKPGILIYGEPWTGGLTPLGTQSNKAAIHGLPIGAFNDDFRNALKGLPDGVQPGFIQNGSQLEPVRKSLAGSYRIWTSGPAQSINYLTCHDNLVLYDKLKLSMPAANETQLKATMKLGYTALFTAQGVPFLHGGEEFARTKRGNSNSSNAPDTVNAVDWSLKKKNYDLFSYTKELIALRKAHPLFRLHTAQEVESRFQYWQDPGSKVLLFTVNGSGITGETWKEACVALNPADAPSTTILPAGEWLIVLDGNGAVRDRPVSKETVVPPKSALVLYQP